MDEWDFRFYISAICFSKMCQFLGFNFGICAICLRWITLKRKSRLSEFGLGPGVLVSIEDTTFSQQPNTFTFIFRRARWSCLTSSGNWSKCIVSGSNGPVSTTPSLREACSPALALNLSLKRDNRKIKRQSPANLQVQSPLPQWKSALPPPASLWAHGASLLIHLSKSSSRQIQSTRIQNQSWRLEKICGLITSPLNILVEPQSSCWSD